MPLKLHGMTKAAKLKLSINQGATYPKRLRWRAPSGAPIDLTGCKARMQLRSEVDSPLVLLELTTENGRILLGGTEGTIDLLISAADTAAIAWESAVWDLEIEFPDGTVHRLAQGSCTVSREVTRG